MEKSIREKIQNIIAVNCDSDEDETNNVIMYDSFEKLTNDFIELINELKIFQIDEIVKSYKDGFDSATQTLISANKMVQEKSISK